MVAHRDHRDRFEGIIAKLFHAERVALGVDVSADKTVSLIDLLGAEDELPVASELLSAGESFLSRRHAFPSHEGCLVVSASLRGMDTTEATSTAPVVVGEHHGTTSLLPFEGFERKMGEFCPVYTLDCTRSPEDEGLLFRPLCIGTIETTGHNIRSVRRTPASLSEGRRLSDKLAAALPVVDSRKRMLDRVFGPKGAAKAVEILEASVGEHETGAVDHPPIPTTTNGGGSGSPHSTREIARRLSEEVFISLRELATTHKLSGDAGGFSVERQSDMMTSEGKRKDFILKLDLAGGAEWELFRSEFVKLVPVDALGDAVTNKTPRLLTDTEKAEVRPFLPAALVFELDLEAGGMMGAERGGGLVGASRVLRALHVLGYRVLGKLLQRKQVEQTDPNVALFSMILVD